jgi:hypothetical protein
VYFNQEQRARSRRLTTPAGWPPCSSRQATTLLSFDIRWDLLDVNRVNRRSSSSRSSWSGRPVITVRADPGFAARGSSDPCARRGGILYATGAYFLCRHCCGLVYQSQREDAEGRAALRAFRLRARLGDYGDLLDPLPKRPPGMRLRTYQRLCDEIDAATERACWAV